MYERFMRFPLIGNMFQRPYSALRTAREVMTSANSDLYSAARQCARIIETPILTLASSVYQYIRVPAPLVSVLPCSDGGRIGV